MAHSTTHRQEDERIVRAWVFGVLVAFSITMLVLVTAAVTLLHARRKGLSSAETVGTRPNPAAEVSSIRSDLFARPSVGTRLKQQQRAALARFRWVDKQHGIVALPIDVAIDVVAKEQP